MEKLIFAVVDNDLFMIELVFAVDDLIMIELVCYVTRILFQFC